MKGYSYVLRYDCGFAPNPFGGHLTLATCKPQIRCRAAVGDVIIGTGSKQTAQSELLIYAAQVSAVVPLHVYGRNKKYRIKRPHHGTEHWCACGDNIYYQHNNAWRQRPNRHHGTDASAKDISGVNALICNLFWYFGRDAIALPNQLRELICPGRNYRNLDESRVKLVMNWLSEYPQGIHGLPALLQDVNPPDCRLPHTASRRALCASHLESLQSTSRLAEGDALRP